MVKGVVLLGAVLLKPLQPAHDRERLELVDLPRQVVDHRAVAQPSERVRERSVVPELVGVGVEAAPNVLAVNAEVSRESPDVVQLVGERDTNYAMRSVGEMRDVALLARSPRGLRDLVRITAPEDDVRHALAEAAANRVEHLPAATVLDRVVEQCGDRLFLATAVLENERRDAEQVRKVRHGGSFTCLCPVQARGEAERIVEPVAEPQKP